MNSEHAWDPCEYGNEPLLTDEEILQEKLGKVKRQVITTICRELDIPINDVYKESFSFTGKKGLNWYGLENVVKTDFPAEMLYTIPIKGGKGKPFTLNRLLANPMNYYLFTDFCLLVEKSQKPAFLVSVHPRIKSFIAMTNLPMSPDYLCYQTTFDPVAELKRLRRNKTKMSTQDPNHHEQQKSGMQVVTFGEFERILQAMRRQEIWIPY